MLTLRTTQRFVGAACPSTLPLTLTATESDHPISLRGSMPILLRVTPAHPRGVPVGRFVPSADATPPRDTWTVTVDIPEAPAAYHFLARVPGTLFHAAHVSPPLSITRIASHFVLPDSLRPAVAESVSYLPVVPAVATETGYRTTLAIGIQVGSLGMEPMRFVGAMRMTALCSTATTVRWGDDQSSRAGHETTPTWRGCGGWRATCVIDEAIGDVNAPDPVRLVTYTIEDPQSHVVIESRSLTFAIAYPAPAPARLP
jgi:hypothetical protein